MWDVGPRIGTEARRESFPSIRRPGRLIRKRTTVTTDDAAAPPALQDAADRVVVGVDGSPASWTALLWALAAAARAGVRLEVVHAYPVDFVWMDPFLVDTGRIADIRSHTEAQARAFVDEARQDPALSALPGAAEVEVDVVVAGGAPAQHLVARARGAEALVVGSRGRGTVRSALLGSVALHCVTHAGCAVVVVHDDVPQSAGPVVVGIDDSAASSRVLVRAAQEAQRLGAQLEPVAVYLTPAYWGDSYAMTATLSAEGREQARRGAEAIVSEALGSASAATVEVAEGRPGEVLVDRAEGAALLVVGSRSRSQLAGTVLGSVALHCAVHAKCPVMVIRPEPGGETRPVGGVVPGSAETASSPGGRTS